MGDDMTHTVTITVTGNYPHGHKQQSQVMISGDGGLVHMMEAFKSALIAAGFSLDIAKMLDGATSHRVERSECPVD